VRASAEAITELERQERLSDDILRYLTVKVEELDEEPSMVMQTRSSREERTRRPHDDERPRRSHDDEDRPRRSHDDEERPRRARRSQEDGAADGQDASKRAEESPAKTEATGDAG
jgi:small subunit ribosomal protein S6